MSLFVDLDNIKNNIIKIKEYTKKEIMVVLKNNAYELNSKRIIPLLKEVNVKWIVYNKFDEYILDKDNIKDFNILILESPKEKYLNLPVYYSVNSVDDANLIKNINTKTLVHLQIDTGMNRMGIRSIDVMKEVIKILSFNKNIIIDGIYTHFASNRDEYYYFNKQVNNFNTYLTLYPFNHIHCESSHSLGRKVNSNMVRVGISIYGYETNIKGIKPCISYYVKPVNSFKISKKDAVGYDQQYIEESSSYITVLPIGYDDIIGINEIRKNDKKLEIVGKICMNHLFIKSNEKINNLTSLLVLSKNDIISYRDYNWYLIITSMKKIPKNYIRRSFNDLPKVFKTRTKKSRSFRLRKRSH